MNFFDFLRLRQSDPSSVMREGEIAASIGLLDPMSVVREGEVLGVMPQTMNTPQVGIDPMAVVREGELPLMGQPVAGGLLSQVDPSTVMREPEMMEMLRRLYFVR